MLKLLAFDYGASSGRAMLGSFDGGTLQLKEMHRFANEPVTINGGFYWDILRLFHEMKQAVIKCVKNGEGSIGGIGIDTWGVDFGLLDSSGELLGNPRHYRDSYTDGMIERACEIVPKWEIYRQTGIQFQKFNTLYQLLAMKANNSPLLEKASTMLMVPDLLNYFLTGVKASEYTIASTSQMYDIDHNSWAKSLLCKLGIPDGILTDIIEPCTVVGSLTKELSGELGTSRLPVIAVAEHDTGSAVASVPVTRGKYVYLSSGTWSLMGIESVEPIVNQAAFELNYTNEGGINRTTRFLKNIMGLWIYQECKRYWDKTSEALGYDELEQLASETRPFSALIDPDCELFYSPGNMPVKVMRFCSETGQQVPRTKGEIVRCIIESLALKYKMALEGLEDISKSSIPVIHIVGGGSKNTMLCRFTADATGKPVVAGPVEATAIGNLAAQLISLGEVRNLKEARLLVKRSFLLNEYTPSDTESWEEAYLRFKDILAKSRECTFD